MPPSEGQEPRALTVAAQAIEGQKCAETTAISKRPNHRIYGLKAGVLPFASKGGREFGSAFRHQ